MARSRLARLRDGLRRKSLDALLVSSLPNIRFLTRFSGSNALLVVRRDRATFLTDPRYALQSREEVSRLRRIVTQGSLVEAAAAHDLLRRCRRVGFEAHHVTFAQYRMLRRLFPGVEFRSTADLVEDVALLKDRDEIAQIDRAVRITDRVFSDLLPLLRPGVTEIDVSAHISYLHRRYGADRDGFEPIVAGGERGALPHARATTRRFRRGEFVTLDFGCSVGGYHSDLTRTVALGRPSSELRRAYAVVLEAQTEAIAAARAGMPACDLDAVARTFITRAGFGKLFSHSLGHGLGLRLHERPRVSMANREPLRAGSVITVEPGVYAPGKYGVRIEDVVLLTPTGCRVLSHAPRELIVL